MALASLKGIVFVFITGLLLYKLIRVHGNKLLKNESHYRIIYEDNPMPMWVYDLKTFKFLSVNRAAINEYGYTKEEFLQKTILDIRPKDEVSKVLYHVNEVSRSTKNSGPWRHIKSDGSEILVNISSQVIDAGNHGDEPAVMIIAQNITEKVIFEQKLEDLNSKLVEQKGRLSETQKIAKVGGWEFYPQDNRLIFSEEMYYLTDTKPGTEENLFNLYLMHIHPDDRPEMTKALHLLLAMGQEMDVTHRVTLSDGRVRYIRQRAKMSQDKTGPIKVIGSAQDVTELKLMELERNKYLFSLENTLNSISEGFYTLNKEMVFTRINKNFELEMGLGSEHIIGKKLTEVFPGIDERETYFNLKTVLLQRVPRKFEAYSRQFKKWLSVAAYPTEEGVAVYLHDITEQKEKDIRLKEAVDRYELVLKATQDVIYDFDLVQNKMVYNTSLKNLLNINVEHIENSLEFWRKLVHPDDLEKVMAIQQDVIAGKGSNWNCEYRLYCGEGNYKYVYDQTYISYNEKNEPTRLIGAIKDIDALKRAHEENHRLAGIITKINNMVVVMDKDHHITWVNKAFEDYCGYPLDEIRGKFPNEVLGSVMLCREKLKEIRERKERLETFSIDVEHYLKDDTRRWVNIEYTPLYDDQQNHAGYIAVHQDITARKQKEQQIQQQNNILQEISWMSSHEIRRPVASLLGLSYLYKDCRTAKEKEEIVAMMDQCAHELDCIVHTITDKITEELYLKQQHENKEAADYNDNGPFDKLAS